jgi:hypothetical protein
MIDPTMSTLAEPEADLAISEAELAAGDIVSWQEITAEVEATVTRLEVKEQPSRRRGPMPRS